MLKHGILGLLNYGDMTGYEIMEVFRDSLNYFWKAQTSQIYRELGTLKDRGFVTVTEVKGENRPDRKVFSITGEGREELIRWLREEDGFDTRSRLLMLTFFRGELPAEENVGYFRALRNTAESFGGGMGTPAGKTAFYAEKVPDPGKAVYWRMTVEYGKMYAEMLAKWCDKCIEILEESGK